VQLLESRPSGRTPGEEIEAVLKLNELFGFFDLRYTTALAWRATGLPQRPTESIRRTEKEHTAEFSELRRETGRIAVERRYGHVDLHVAARFAE
jgi:hypothetical protein